jgi:hypothetical protein
MYVVYNTAYHMPPRERGSFPRSDKLPSLAAISDHLIAADGCFKVMLGHQRRLFQGDDPGCLMPGRSWTEYVWNENLVIR